MKNNLRSAGQQPDPVKSSVLSINFYEKITVSWSLNTRAKVGLDITPRNTLCRQSTFREKGLQVATRYCHQTVTGRFDTSLLSRVVNSSRHLT